MYMSLLDTFKSDPTWPKLNHLKIIDTSNLEVPLTVSQNGEKIKITAYFEVAADSNFKITIEMEQQKGTGSTWKHIPHLFYYRFKRNRKRKKKPIFSAIFLVEYNRLNVLTLYT